MQTIKLYILIEWDKAQILAIKMKTIVIVKNTRGQSKIFFSFTIDSDIYDMIVWLIMSAIQFHQNVDFFLILPFTSNVALRTKLNCLKIMVLSQYKKFE